MKEPFVLTVATENNDYVKNLELNLNNLGYNFKILGLQTKWKGFDTKMKLLINELKTLNNNTIVVVVDAYDVLFARKPEELLKKYIYFGENKIVIGSNPIASGHWSVDKACKIKDDFNSKSKNRKAERNNPNCGFIMGTAGNLLKMYEHALKNGKNVDSIGVDSFFKENCDKFKIDFKSEFVANVFRSNSNNVPFLYKYWNQKKFTHDFEGLVNKHTGEIPFVFHFPYQAGDYGARREEFSKLQNKNYKGIQKKNYKSDFKKLKMKFLEKQKNKIINIILLIILIILIVIFYLRRNLKLQKNKNLNIF
tara:strand:+ start:4775 stop:5698 length:924 start_codon:yes stop_codon:yes gene_type:complete